MGTIHYPHHGQWRPLFRFIQAPNFIRIWEKQEQNILWERNRREHSLGPFANYIALRRLYFCAVISRLQLAVRQTLRLSFEIIRLIHSIGLTTKHTRNAANQKLPENVQKSIRSAAIFSRDEMERFRFCFQIFRKNQFHHCLALEYFTQTEASWLNPCTAWELKKELHGPHFPNTYIHPSLATVILSTLLNLINGVNSSRVKTAKGIIVEKVRPQRGIHTVIQSIRSRIAYALL